MQQLLKMTLKHKRKMIFGFRPLFLVIIILGLVCNGLFAATLPGNVALGAGSVTVTMTTDPFLVLDSNQWC